MNAEEPARYMKTGTYCVNGYPMNVVFVALQPNGVLHLRSPYECGNWNGYGFFSKGKYVGVFLYDELNLDDPRQEQQGGAILSGTAGIHVGTVKASGEIEVHGENITEPGGSFDVVWTPMVPQVEGTQESGGKGIIEMLTKLDLEQENDQGKD